MSSVASNTAPSAANANSKKENCRETRAMRNAAAAANSSAGQVSRDSSSSASACKRSLEQQHQQGPTTRSSRRRKLSSTSDSCSSDKIDECESDDSKDCGGAVAVESEPDNLLSNTASVKKERRPAVQIGSTKIGNDSCTSSPHIMDGGDGSFIIPWRIRRKRKLQTDPSVTIRQGDERSDHETEDKKSEPICLNDFKIPANAIHNPTLDETNTKVCKSIIPLNGPPFDIAKTSPIEPASFFNDGNDNKGGSLAANSIEKEQCNTKTPTFNELGVAQEVKVNKCSRTANVETQLLTIKGTEEYALSLNIDDHMKDYASSEEQEALEDIQKLEKLEEKEAIGSPALSEKVVNERGGNPNEFHAVDLEKETLSIRISDDGAVGAIDPDHFTEEQPKLNRWTEELDQRITLRQSNDSSPSEENTVDDPAMEPSQQTALTIADPCDAEKSCSKINGCFFVKIATPDTSLMDENLTVAEQCPENHSLEILNAREDVELCDSSRNLLLARHKPVSLCIDDQRNTTSTNAKFYLVDSIKVAIHAEASQVHCGKGANKLFSEYLERLGVYLSNASSFRSSRRTASTNCFAHGSTNFNHDSSIESFFSIFLTTKRLRTMHNKLILVLMKFSMESQVPCEKFCNHIPHQWLHNVKEGSSSTAVDALDAFTSEPVEIKINQQRAELMNQIRYVKSYFSVESGLWAQSDTSNVLHPPPLHAINAVTAKLEHDNSSILPSGTIPGALTIDPLVRNIAQREGISVDEYALWLIIIATRQFTLEILQRSVIETSHSGRTVNDVVLESSNGDAKLRTISTQDLAFLVAKSRTTSGNKFSIHSSSSRVLMDRLVNAAGRRMFPCPPEAPMGVQQAIVQLIQATSCMRSKSLAAPTTQVPGTENFSMIDARTEASPALACERRLGKTVGEPEYDSNSQQLLSPASINSTSAEPETLRQVQGKDDKPKAHEEKNGSEKLSATVASDIPRKRAGGKDLAALRARRMASAQPEQPSQENATVTDVGVAMATTLVNSLPTAKERGY